MIEDINESSSGGEYIGHIEDTVRPQSNGDVEGT
jgi:hypothetical protein